MLKETKIDTKKEVRAKGGMKETGRRLGQRKRAEIERPSQGTGEKEAQGEAASSQPGEAGTFLPARSVHSCTAGP